MKPRLSQLAQSGAATGDVATWDGSKWAPAATNAGLVARDRLTASNGNDTLTLGAVPVDGSPLVWVNGTLLWPGVDYTITDDVITFTTPLDAGDIVTDWYTYPSGTADAAALSGTGPLVEDSFDRADSSVSLGTADSGQSWTALAGTWGIASNKARQITSGTQAFAVIDAGVADGTIQVTVSGTLNSGGGICFRASDASNCLFIELADSTTTVIYKQEAGGFTGLTSINPLSWTAGDVMSVELSGTAITLKKNGTTVGSTTSSFNQTATKHGLRDYGGVIRFDDFSVL